MPILRIHKPLQDRLSPCQHRRRAAKALRPKRIRARNLYRIQQIGRFK